jgi:hypothetical protein
MSENSSLVVQDSERSAIGCRTLAGYMDGVKASGTSRTKHPDYNCGYLLGLKRKFSKHVLTDNEMRDFIHYISGIIITVFGLSPEELGAKAKEGDVYLNRSTCDAYIKTGPGETDWSRLAM